MKLNPLDNRIIKDIKDTQRKVYNGGIFNQPFLGDKYSLNPSDYVYDADNVIQTTESEIERWTKGDKIFLRQNGIDKTFYVTRVGVNDPDDNLLRLYGGIDFVYTNHPIEEAYISKYPAPGGFQQLYELPIVLSATGSMTATPFSATETLFFSMNGQIVTITGYIPDITLGGSASYGIEWEVPGEILPSFEFNTTVWLNYGVNNSTDVVLKALFTESFPTLLNRIVFIKMGAGNWTTGSQIASIGVNISYSV